MKGEKATEKEKKWPGIEKKAGNKLKRCKKCQKFFYGVRSDQKYCSPICAYASAKSYYKPAEKKTLACAECGKEFTWERSTQRYCSDACRLKANYTGIEKNKVCLYCGKGFVTTRDKTLYCCKEHAHEAKLAKDKQRVR
jgi:hypothetical protein